MKIDEKLTLEMLPWKLSGSITMTETKIDIN